MVGILPDPAGARGPSPGAAADEQGRTGPACLRSPADSSPAASEGTPFPTAGWTY
ncbi:hypothetical protein [Streptomyces sp. NPDC051662]|uniref:hypothetical protein n=1 Tax=Streptomyces sp. NPDC051662 TaxID=3154750 RepID=UPI0034292748